MAWFESFANVETLAWYYVSASWGHEIAQSIIDNASAYYSQAVIAAARVMADQILEYPTSIVSTA